MKKFGLLFLISGLISFSSCGEAKQPTQAHEKTPASELNEPTDKTTDKGIPVHLTKAIFIEKVWDYTANPNEWVYKGDKPCIIDFYADWCAPCRKVAPIMDELAKEYEGEIYVYKIDTQHQRELAQVFNIQSIPSVLFCPAQGKPQMSMGALPKSAFVESIEKVLLNKDSE